MAWPPFCQLTPSCSLFQSSSQTQVFLISAQIYSSFLTVSTVQTTASTEVTEAELPTISDPNGNISEEVFGDQPCRTGEQGHKYKPYLAQSLNDYATKIEFYTTFKPLKKILLVK